MPTGLKPNLRHVDYRRAIYVGLVAVVTLGSL